MESKLKAFLKSTEKSNLIKSADNAFYYLQNHLFKGINLKGKNVLDIGGGSGLYSFCSICLGAESAEVLEPLSDGSNAKMENDYKLYSEVSGSNKVTFLNNTFQAQAFDKKYSAIILHNSINHLDEDACEKLPNDPDAVNTYTEIFKKLYDICADDVNLIITDASRKNFYNQIGITNPFRKNIEWHKHCQPSDWSNLLKSAGFKIDKISWRGPNNLRTLGFPLNNYIGSYFTMSSFVIHASK